MGYYPEVGHVASAIILIVELICCLQIFDALFDMKVNKLNLFIASSIWQLTTFFVLNFLKPELITKTVFVLLSLFFLMVFLYHGKIFAKAFAVAFVFAVMILIEFVNQIVLLQILEKTNHQISEPHLFFVFCAMVNCSVIFAAAYLLKKLIGFRRRGKSTTVKQFVVFCCFRLV